MTLSDPNPGFKVTVYLQVEYLADDVTVFNCTKHICRPQGVKKAPKPCKKIWGRRFFAKSAGCFTPVIEIKPNTFSPH